MTVSEQIELACLMEATARKPGNVHPAARFSDLCYEDFVTAAHVIGEPLAAAPSVGLGRAIYDAIQATRHVTGTNVNLGIVLLLAPLACVAGDRPLDEGITGVLQRTTVDDAENVYAAIRMSQPGGMGEVSQHDVTSKPTVTLREAMSFAASRDEIANQYVSDFSLVFEARDKLRSIWSRIGDWELAVVYLHVWILSQYPDTLIARKCGREIAGEVSSRAKALIVSAANSSINPASLSEFDCWLRADGHRRNPGTTADLIAATLFAAMRDGFVTGPTRAAIQQRSMEIRRESDEHTISDPAPN